MVKNENTKETGPFWAGSHGRGLSEVTELLLLTVA